MFVVKFLNMHEQTKEEFEYTNLLDALRVAKETNLSNSPHTELPAMSESKFNEELLILLTTALVYGGPKTKTFPDGCYMIMLLHRDDETSEERPVYSALPIPRMFGPETNPVIPIQNMNQNH